MDKPIRHREPARGKLAGLLWTVLQLDDDSLDNMSTS